ncbi:hypothetical protein HY497_02220 [Candidatus Woesearchaeota archaeon]|nr:hypothetical protein [Candidatus Woesearchaeota archaeon]
MNMEETIHPAQALEHAVEDVFSGIMRELTVAELRQKICEAIRTVTADLDAPQRSYVEEQLPRYLKDIFGGQTGSAIVGDPDFVRTEAVGLAEANFRDIYHGKN